MRLRVLGFVACALVTGLLSAPISGGELDELCACIEFENDIERLQCFDAAAAELADCKESTPDSAEDVSEGAAPLPETKKTPKRVHPSQIKDADERMVEDCEFLGTVLGKSGWGGLAAGAASKGAMRSAKKRAAAMGATHIVFGHFDNASGLRVSTRQARAYRCHVTAKSTRASTPHQSDGADG